MPLISTRPYRRAMVGYQQANNLAPEKGFDANKHGILLGPGRRLLKRVQEHMLAVDVARLKKREKPLHPDVRVTSTLDKATREALIPPRTLGDKAVHFALAEVGVHESPWGSNSGPRVHEFQSATGAYNAAWCASFVSWCYQHAGYKGPVTARAFDWANLGTTIPLKSARPGDPVIFQIGDGHIGLYLKHDGINVTTVDGNTSDQVAIRQRPLALVKHIVRVN